MSAHARRWPVVGSGPVLAAGATALLTAQLLLTAADVAAVETGPDARPAATAATRAPVTPAAAPASSAPGLAFDLPSASGATAAQVPPAQPPDLLDGQEPAAAVPVEVVLPTLGVTSTLQDLGLEADGELEPPEDWDVAGWYADGPRPGQTGPAVIAGHVDGPDGPAVFWDLEDLEPGDPVHVTRADGSTASFVVTGKLVAPKDDFPTETVYGPTVGPELRLITCDGGFDAGTGHYLDNLVVFARAV